MRFFFHQRKALEIIHLGGAGPVYNNKNIIITIIIITIAHIRT
jgi:hypothetical protein